MAQDLAPSFQRVYWRSLRDALPTSEWLAGAISFVLTNKWCHQRVRRASSRRCSSSCVPLLASGSEDGTIRLWETSSAASLRTLRIDRRYERLDITGLTGVSATQRAALLSPGAVDNRAPTDEPV